MTQVLNPQQKKAIEYAAGPLLIIAGAGTGKTTVITERIKHLILDKDIPPNNILALTFTEKAAYEMQERVDILLPYGYTNLWIHTFHSFCDRILRDEAHAIGLDSNYKLISEAEAVLLMRQNIFSMGLKQFKPLGNPTKFLDGLLVHFSRLSDEDVTPSEYLDWAKKQISSSDDPDENFEQYQELATAYQTYSDLKIKHSLMDFSDLISNTLKLFRERKNILKRYQGLFKFVLVDEFQDTNFAQNELAILLAGDDKNITVVADDDQSIYRFRGAAVSNVLQFKKNFVNAEIVTLADNYRSTQEILDASYSLIQNNNPNRLEVVENIDKKLKSHTKPTSKAGIEIIHETRAEDEAEEVAKTIVELTRKSYQYSDIAILVRANNHAHPFTAALARHRIPYQFLGPGYLFQQEEVKDLIAYLTFLTNLSDTAALFRVLSMDIFKISYIELNYLLNFAKRSNLTLFEALDENQPFLKQETQDKLSEFKKMVERHMSRSKVDSAGQVLYYFLVDSKLYDTLNITDSVKDERRVQNIAKFFDRINNFETERPDSNIFIVVEWLTLMLQMGDSPTAADVDTRDRNAVNLLTVHSSKGLEFKVVFLVNLVSDRFPSRERNEKIPLPAGIIKEKLVEESDFHLEEERRLFYVGITRAKQKLYFTAADFYGTGKRAKKLSPFIFESLPNIEIDQKKQERGQQLSLNEVLSAYEKTVDPAEDKQPVKVTYITFSNLQMFDICPLHYKAKVIFNIPTPTAAVQSFGISMHNTLYNFYKQLQEGGHPTLSDMQNLLKREWISQGYEGKAHEEERRNQAESILDVFYKEECNPPIVPIGLELPFSFTLKNGVKVFGKIDRIDKKGNGIEIIDYKTGQDNPKAESAHELQLAMYALAATRVKDPLLNRDPADITLTLHFLEGNTKKSMSFTKEDLEKLEDELVEKIEEIEKSEFKCSKNVLCVNCEYRILCNPN
ncbi:MAG TPA: ATP-dependent DNA helicase [Patescibacteria group bacterium]|nr:ATP-dependent DNA helicase [Patescibacteria group bacterium]